MQLTLDDTYNKETGLTRKRPSPTSAPVYSEFLQKLNVNYKPYEYYWQVGEISRVQGWLLHLSVVISQIEELFEIVLPTLVAEAVPFKIVKDRITASYLLEGNLGYINVGKIVSIYPTDDVQALIIAKELIRTTTDFKGPEIPTDRLLGTIVYTRHGSFNPLITKGANGERIKQIYNHKGDLIQDPYSVPFSLPTAISWPFAELASPIASKPPKILNSTYYPIQILKNDVKGKVLKALYFKQFARISSCVVKEARKNMYSDANGRDIRERLQWQYKLSKQLSGQVPMPELIEYFEENGNTYLAMEFIKGISLFSFISDIYGDRSWLDLPVRLQIKLLDRLTDVVTIVARLHDLGFVHRDIQPENFLIDRKGKMWLIDMELAWSLESSFPSPPFKLGTPGFTSPQQMATEIPTIKEDIYAVGAMMLVFFTSLIPSTFPLTDSPALNKAVHFLIQDQEIADLITSCLNADPDRRPQLNSINQLLNNYRKKLEFPTLPIPLHPVSTDIQDLQHAIQAGIRGLANPELLSSRHRWLSPMIKNENYIGNDQWEMSVYEGWHTGVAGPLWLIARAKLAEFEIESCGTPYHSSWAYIFKNHFDNSSDLGPGLYMGKAGIAFAMAEGLTSGLLPSDNIVLQRLAQCFAQHCPTLSISDGLSGQILALLRAAEWLPSKSLDVLLTPRINKILQTQLPGGLWSPLSVRRPPTEGDAGFSTGTTGITWALLAYLETDQENTRVRSAIINSMNWLINYYQLTNPTTCRSQKVTMNTILLFLKAFQFLKDPLYLEITETRLAMIPYRPVTNDFTLGNGLTALGELLLEAFAVLGDPIWHQRAGWIAELYLRCIQKREETDGYWLVNKTTTATADLFGGNSGLIHFLIRCQHSKKFSHPLWPNSHKPK